MPFAKELPKLHKASTQFNILGRGNRVKRIREVGQQ